MSAGSAGLLPPPEDEATREAAGCAGDRLAALVSGHETPTAHCVIELRHAWRHAQREARDAYAGWRSPGSCGGHPVFLAALDREERAAAVYAEVHRRAKLRSGG